MNGKPVNSQTRTSRFLTALWVALVSGVAFLAVSFLFYRFTINSLLSEARFSEVIAARELSLGIQSLIESRTSSLHALSEASLESLKKGGKNIERTFLSILRNQPGIYALTWVVPSGEIDQIHPARQNARALGQNLLEKPSVATYLREARDQRRPMLTHLIRTYQGIDTFAIIVPVFNGNTFVGWMSAVMDHQAWLDEFLRVRNYKDLYFKLCWERFSGNCYEYGIRPEKRNDNTSINFEVMNQPLQVEASMQSVQPETQGRWLSWMFGIIMLGVAMLIGWIVFIAQRSHLRWLNAISVLKLRNASIHALINELSPCVTEMDRLANAAADSARGGGEELIAMVERQKRLLTDTRQLQGVSQGRDTLLLTEVSLFEALQHTKEKLRSLAEERNVRFDIRPDVESAPKVIVDRALVEESVLEPLLRSAMELVGERAAIQISSDSDRSSTRLRICVDGRWSQLEIACHEADPATGLADFRRESWTWEALGLLQAVILMEHFRGELSFNYERNQTIVTLEFVQSRRLADTGN